MRVRALIPRLSLSLSFAALPTAALASAGLVAPPADMLWPQWQARIALQTAAVSPLGLSRLLEGTSPQRGWQGAALLGDYYFATPSFGGFRASGGLMFGSTGGAPLLSAPLGSRLGLTLQGAGTLSPPGAESPGTLPYLGLGFTSAAWRRTLSLTADLGWVAEQPSAVVGVGRALFGTQGKESAWRELRLSPVLQVGLRYTF